MEGISGFPMAQAIQNEIIYRRLRELGFADRDIRSLERNET